MQRWWQGTSTEAEAGGAETNRAKARAIRDAPDIALEREVEILYPYAANTKNQNRFACNRRKKYS